MFTKDDNSVGRSLFKYAFLSKCDLASNVVLREIFYILLKVYNKLCLEWWVAVR